MKSMIVLVLGELLSFVQHSIPKNLVCEDGRARILSDIPSALECCRVIPT